MNISELHSKARRAIEAGVSKFRDAAECLAKAKKLGATQRQSAKAIGKSAAWVNVLLKWREGGYKNHCPFPRATRAVQPAKQNSPRPPTEAQTARVNADRAKAEFQTARAEVVAKMFGPQTKTIPAHARQLLIAALCALASDRPAERATAALTVENARARLNLKWYDLIVPADAQSEVSKAA
jgi:hypothetical protein